MAYVGIDLGTTNSVIASYDGTRTRLYKSPEQHDVTPSVIYATKRSRFVGWHAYNQAAANPRNAALLFKRFMGTSTPIHLAAAGQTLSAVDASAEILATLVGYLPQEIRNSSDTGTVITVPAAFNQLQRDATLAAANQADIGLVALMQEPVAAVMSVMEEDKSDGVFLIYDLGGGTLDIAIAESIGGRVSLLQHGGVAMLGGRDMDRSLFDNIVKPWLFKEFNLPIDATRHEKYEKVFRLATWATERAKIELSQRESTKISLAEDEIRVRDLDGQEIYLEIPLDRSHVDRLIQRLVDDSVKAARDTIRQAGLSSHDIARIVFVGGPTHYPPLRETVAFELGINGSTIVNPMTAVATGAAIFAESINWAEESRGRKKARGTIETGAPVSFRFDARTPRDEARIVAVIEGGVLDGMQIQLDSLSTGWTSGRMPLSPDKIYNVPLLTMGIHSFKITVFDSSGRPAVFENNVIEITRTAASIEAIPCPHTISVEAREKAGGFMRLVPLARAGDHLPKSGTIGFQAEKVIVAGEDDSLNFKLWEGEIKQPIEDNVPIGMMKVAGTDLVSGQIALGAELLCHFVVIDSGNVKLEVEIPSLGTLIKDKLNYYERKAAEVDFSGSAQRQRIREEQESINHRIEAMEEQVSDHRLDEARAKLERIDQAALLAGDPETAKQSSESIQEAKRLLAEVREDNRIEILQRELDAVVQEFNEEIRDLAEPTEEIQFDNLARSTQRSVLEGGPEAEDRISELRGRIFRVLWRQSWFIEDWFDGLSRRPWLFADQDQYQSLIAEGRVARDQGNASRLRALVWELNQLRFGSSDEDDITVAANIIYCRRE